MCLVRQMLNMEHTSRSSLYLFIIKTKNSDHEWGTVYQNSLPSLPIRGGLVCQNLPDKFLISTRKSCQDGNHLYKNDKFQKTLKKKNLPKK